MSFVEMVDILKRADYDRKYGPYPNPNVRKAKIMVKVVKSLHWNFGVRRSKDQLRKQWSDLKLKEHEQYRRIRRVLQKKTIVPQFQAMFHIPISAIKYLCAKYTYFFHIGEKRLGEHHSSEETTDPPPQEEGEIPQSQQEVEEGDVVEIVTTTDDRDVVNEGNFTSESAQILIGEIMGYNRDLENIKQTINDVQNKMKNIIDVLGRV
ncbi:hypothetical protein AB205_0042440 [Aquarana catesbeiana]|uniref:Uncharacterized protein n=2 Tax=Aquarana catesbeiana TaxID=8400 RepID=A0A2G9Q8L0_AQUCT|nr:hypothetical protein AB205_0042440 [Aquarana catesbeiana]